MIKQRVYTKRQVGAYLTVFMSLTLMLVMSLCLVLIEAARQNTIRLEAECIVDIGMNSILAEYHREIMEQYNLFFLDSSYGSDYPSYYNTEARLKKYIEKNAAVNEEMGSSILVPGVYLDLLKQRFSEIKVIGVSLATDNNGYNLQKQAIEVIKSDMGITAAEEILTWIKVVEEHRLLENHLEEEMDEINQQLEGLKKEKQGQLDEGIWQDVEIKNPVQGIVEMKKSGFLSWMLGNPKEISAKTVDLEQYISKRRKNMHMNQGNIFLSDSLSAFEKLLFQEYLIQYTGNFLSVKENSLLDYQNEYLLFGNGSDNVNLEKTVAAICGMRETANLLYLTTSAEKKKLISAAAAVLSAAVFLPEAEPVFEAAIILGWSLLESMQDMKSLLEGGKVPLLKDDQSWNCSLENVFDLSIKEENEPERGMEYADYLRLLMYFSDMEILTYRFMDILEMDIRKTEGNSDFRLDGCIDYLEVQICVESGYGYRYQLKHAKGYR